MHYLRAKRKIRSSRIWSRLVEWDSSQDLLTLSLNYRVIILVFLIVFGFFGWGTFDSSSNILTQRDFLVTLCILISLVGVFRFKDKINEELPILRISGRFFLSFIFFLCLGCLFNLGQLNRDLTGDELFYARQAQIYSIELLFQLRNQIPNSLSNLNSSYFLHLSSFLLMIFISLLLLILMKIRRELSFLIISLVLLLATRQTIQIINPNDHVLSPLPSAWYFSTSSIFGFSSFVFRISTLVIYSLLATYIYTSFRGQNKLSNLASSCCALLVYSIPLVNEVSTLVEPAGWTFLTVCALLVSLKKRNFVVNEFHIFALALATYLRMNIGFALCAVLVSYIARRRYEAKLPFNALMIAVFILLPSLITIFIVRIPQRFSTGENPLTVFTDNVYNFYQLVMINNVHFYVLIILIGVALMITEKSSRVLLVAYVFFAVLLFQVFQFSNLSGYVKYMVEYLYPLLVLVCIYILTKLSKSTVGNWLVVLMLLSINAFGFVSQSNASDKYKFAISKPLSGIAFGLSASPYAPYPYKEVFEFIQERNLVNCLNTGIVYGIFPEIQAGYSIKQLFDSNDARERFLAIQTMMQENVGDVTADSISRAKVSCVIIGMVQNQKVAVGQLEATGWAIYYKARDLRYGNEVYLLGLKREFDEIATSGAIQ